MKAKPTPSQAVLCERLKYDPFTGVLYFKLRGPEGFKSLRSCNSWNSKFAGKPALNSINGDGYRSGSLDYQPLLAHRVIWKMVFGYDADQVDHQNGIRHENHLLNLRDANDVRNSQNRHLRSDNSSGYPGVYKIKGREAWTVEITYKRNTIYLGCFRCFDKAVNVRKAAETIYMFHRNHGRNDAISNYAV